ncbi:MAG: glycosyltransferase [Deltaproteobacteria bacterium]|nr:glycosyltransferase [Deltaproteobacteria bacterium]
MPYSKKISIDSHNRRLLRVLFVVLSMGVGGAEKLVYDIIQGLPQKNITPTVCCLDMIGPLGDKLVTQGIRVYYLKRKRGIDWGLVKRLNRIIVREKIDVVHAHQYTPYFYAVLSSLMGKKIRLIFTEHGRLYPDRRRIKRYLFNPLLAGMTDHIVSISESTKKAMVMYDNFPAQKIEVIFNGVHFDDSKTNIVPSTKRRLLQLDNTSRVMGTAARLDEIKNIPMLLHVFKRVLAQMPQTYLLIAGKGPKEKELKDLSKHLGVEDRVVFLGLRYDLPEIYPLFDVFLLTSFTEGISITLLESMAAGVPSVVTAVGGNPEVVIDGKTGYLVPTGEEQTMATKVLELLRSPEKQKTMGANAAERASKDFSFQKMLSRYLQLYQGSL